MSTHPDLRAAVEALADEWENDRGILSPDSRYTRDVLVRELRALLAAASSETATPLHLEPVEHDYQGPSDRMKAAAAQRRPWAEVATEVGCGCYTSSEHHRRCED